MPSSQLLITLCTYNEIENLPRLVDEIVRHAPQAKILVIDDNSPDGTGEWCDEHADRLPQLSCLHRAGKLGLGSATLAGFRYAIEHDFDWVLNLDADFSHPPRFIADLLARMGLVDSAVADGSLPPAEGKTSRGDEAEHHQETATAEKRQACAPREADAQDLVDIVIGSRYVEGGLIEGWPWYRRLMSRCMNCYARWLLGLSVNDCTGSFRCYRVDSLRQLDFNQFISQGYSYLEEILWRLRRQGACFAEIPITFVDRQYGKTKINTTEAVSAVWIIFQLAVGLRR